jgi:capsular polysaccharide export protein
VPPSPAQRSFLFLQGPPGPLLRLLGQALAARGARVLRINLNGGDAHDWAGPQARAYRGPARHWPRFVATTLQDYGITDLVLFGDCRPRHRVACAIARQRGLRIHVIEEGYLRPSWLTLEREGVNGHSTLSRDPQTYLAQAETLPPLPLSTTTSRPPVDATLRRRIHDTTYYFTNMVLQSPFYPFYRSHRPGSIVLEGLGWIAKHRLRAATGRQTRAALQRIAHWQGAGGRVMLLPLQLSSDYQIRAHSPFATMRDAARHILASFAAHAPADLALIVKDHPLDTPFSRWAGWLRREAGRHGLGERLIHLPAGDVPGADLRVLSQTCAGLVTVNSTSATFALAQGVPTMALGRAVYALPGLTDQGPLDRFWHEAAAPDPALWDAFTRVLHHRCLIRGGLASDSAVAMAVEGALHRLLAEPA